MYTPKYYKPKDNAEIISFIKENGFATLVSQQEGKLWATHIPLMFSADDTKLLGHISKGNGQKHHFTQGNEVLAIFQGPHGYISSSWYNHENVPTWNYMAAHVYGTINILEGEALLDSLKSLTHKYEKHSRNPVSVEKMTPAYVQQEMKALIGFELVITRMEAAWKLSQNRDRKNYDNIIQELDQRGLPGDRELSDAMKKNISSIKP